MDTFVNVFFDVSFCCASAPKMSLRKQQGELIAQSKGSNKRLDDNNYLVNSE